MRRSLILIRHSIPEIIEGTPAETWVLSPDGRAACPSLTEPIRALTPARMFTSHEPKAAETGQIIASGLSIPCAAADGLHEHVRTRVPWMGRADFEKTVAGFFAQPDRLVFGQETADQAYTRFATVVDSLSAAYPADTLAIATHGTVITLFLARRTGIDPFPFWKALKMPDYFVIPF